MRAGTRAEAKARVPARIGDVVVKLVEAD